MVHSTPEAVKQEDARKHHLVRVACNVILQTPPQTALGMLQFSGCRTMANAGEHAMCDGCYIHINRSAKRLRIGLSAFQ